MEKILWEMQNPINWCIWSGILIPLISIFLFHKKIKNSLWFPLLLGISTGAASFYGGFVPFIVWIPSIGLYAAFVFKSDWALKKKWAYVAVNSTVTFAVWTLIWILLWIGVI